MAVLGVLGECFGGFRSVSGSVSVVLEVLGAKARIRVRGGVEVWMSNMNRVRVMTRVLATRTTMASFTTHVSVIATVRVNARTRLRVRVRVRVSVLAIRAKTLPQHS